MILVLIMALFLGLVFFGVPIAFSMIATSTVYFLTGPVPTFVNVVPQKMFEGVDSILLTAIPFFLLAGELMNRSGMADRLMHFSNLVVGRVRGGLAYVNVLASLIFSGLTGVAVGDIAALGKIEVNMMAKAGYPRAFSAAVTVSSSLVGPIIPPSGVIILYCAVMELSVGAMFLAAIVPGILMAGGDMLLIALQCKKRNFPVSTTRRTLPEVVKSSRDASLALLMPIILVGGIVGGFMTPTEAAAVAVVYALFVSVVIYRAFTARELVRVFTSTAFESGRLLFLIAGALTMTWIFALENLAGSVAGLFAFADGNVILMVLAVNLLFLFLGMIVEPAIVIILLAPVIGPILFDAGVSPLQFGIMTITNVTVGLATPPIGNVLFAMSSIVNVKIGDLMRELTPFILVKFVLLLLIGLVPALTVWIPTQFGF